MPSARHNQMFEFIASVGKEFQYLPHPRRWSIPSMAEFLVDHHQEAIGLMDKLGRQQAPVMAFGPTFAKNTQAVEQFAKKGGDLGAVPFVYMVRRHQIQKAPIFTVSDALNKMLDDTGVKADIPVLYLAPPFKTCYIELESAEARRSSLEGGANPHRYIEGCYIQENTVDDLFGMTAVDEEIQEMGLDRSKKTRIIDLAFTFSPRMLPDDVDNEHLAYHSNMKHTLYIQNENESLTQLIKRQLQHAKEKLMGFGDDIFTVNKDADLMRDTIIKLSKTLLYLNLNIRDREVEKPGSEVDARLSGVGAKKRGKLERQAAKVYDRIVVGPKHYVPLAERTEESGAEKGRKKPHFRRGYFGIRWIGSGQDKKPELVRVRETLINKDLMVEKTARDYDIS